MKISIVGGGLGGLTAALALLLKGFRVTVFEQAHQLKEVGCWRTTKLPMQYVFCINWDWRPK
jgi:2-polyprenyl-6-methoxyphenol hydroxylase-like FAD-dependent oxidoreductase